MAEEKKNLFSRIFGKKDDEDEKVVWNNFDFAPKVESTKPKEIDLSTLKLAQDKSKYEFTPFEEREKTQEELSEWENYRDIYAKKRWSEIKKFFQWFKRDLDIEDDIYQKNDDWSYIVWDDWERVKKKWAWMQLPRAWIKATGRVLATPFYVWYKWYQMGIEYVSPEDELKKKIYREEKKVEEKKRTDVWYIMSEKTALNFDEHWGWSVKEEIDKIVEENKDELEDYSKVTLWVGSITKKIDEINKIRENEDLDKKTKKYLDEKEEYLVKEYTKLYLEYSLNTKLEWETLDDIFDSVRGVLGVNYSNDQIWNWNIKWINKRIKAIESIIKEIQDLEIKYNMRSDYNVVWLTVDAVADTLEHYWVIMSDAAKSAMFSQSHWDLDDRLKKTRELWWQEAVYKEKIKINIFNEFTMWAADKILITDGDMSDWKKLLSNLLNSDEFLWLKREILDWDAINWYFDEKWNFDYPWYVKYLKSTDVLSKYWWLLDALNAESKASKKWKRADESGTLIEKWAHSFFAGVYDNLIKEQEQQYRKYLDMLDEEKVDKRMVKQIENQYQARMWSVIDPTLTSLKKKDLAYSMNSYYAILDNLNSLMNVVQNNPLETAWVVLSVALPLLWTAWKITSAINIWSKWISSPWLRTLYKVWATVAGEVTEGLAMSTLIDSMWWVEADIRYNLIDFGIWWIRSVWIIRNWITATKIKNDISNITKGLNLTNSADLTKINNDFYSKGYGFLVQQDWKLWIQSFIKGWKIDYNELARSVEMWRLKLKWIPEAKIQELLLKDSLDILWEKNIDILYKRAAGAYWDLTETILKQNNWDKKAVVARYLNDQQATLEKAAKNKLAAWILELSEKEWLNWKLNEVYNKTLENLTNAEKSATPEGIIKIQEAKDALHTWRAEMRMLPLQMAEQWFWNIVKMAEIKTINLNKNFLSKVWQNIKEWPIELASLPKEILDNIWDPKKLSEIILWDEKKYEEFWIRVYDINDYSKEVVWASIAPLSDWQKANLSQILDTIADLNAGNLKIIELPNSLKNNIKWIQWFTTFVEEWWKTDMVIWMVGGLVWTINKWKGVAKNSDIIKVLAHELWHNIMMSLKPVIKNKLMKYIDGFVWNKFSVDSIKVLFDNPNKKRLEYLLSLADNKKVFLEELSADIMSDAIVTWIFWDKNWVANIWEAILSKIQKWSNVSSISWANPFKVLWKRFVNMVETMVMAMQIDKNADDLKWTLYYLAASILDWNKNLIDIWGQASKMWEKSYSLTEQLKKFRELWRKLSWTDISYWKLKETENIPKNVENYKAWADEKWRGEEWIDYIKVWDRLEPIWKRVDVDRKQEQLFYMYKEEWDKFATMSQDINTFEISKLYSDNLVLTKVYDDTVGAEELWALLSLNYTDANVLNRMADELKEWTKEWKKFNEAIQFSQTKHWLAVANLNKFYDWDVIDFTKKVDWFTFWETLLNVSSRITNRWYVEFAWQDFIKYLNYADKETYNKIFLEYINWIAENYDPKVLREIEWVFDAVWIWWKTFWEKYVVFSNMVEKRIYDAALVANPKEVAKEISQDIVSRLFVWSQGYMWNIYYNARNIDIPKFIDEMAYGITKRNKNVSSVSKYSSIYESVLKWFDNKNINKWFAEWLWNLEWWKTLDWGNKSFQWNWYDKNFFNYLSARSEEYIISSLKTLDKSVKMDIEQFSSFINKISWWPTRYEVAINNRLNRLWVLSDIDISWVWVNKTKEWIIWAYKTSISSTESRKNIISKIWEDWYNKLLQDLDDMQKNWLDKDDLNHFLLQSERSLAANSPEASPDTYFRDMISRDKIVDSRKDVKENSVLWLTPVMKTEDYDSIMNKMWEVSVQEAISDTNKLLQEYSLITQEIRSVWFDWVAEKLFDNDLLRPFFNIEWNISSLKTEVLRWRQNSYRLKFENNQSKIKWNWLTKTLWMFVNPATVAESDVRLWKILSKSLDNMSKWFYVWDWAIWNLLKSKKLEWNFVTKKAFLTIFQEEVESHIWKWGLTYDNLVDDISNAYEKKYLKSRKEMKVKDLNYSSSSLDWYKDLVDSYVELLSKRHKDFWFFNEWELKKIFNDIWDTSTSRLFAGARSKSESASKAMWLQWNWVWMSVSDIKALKDEAAIYHPKMFNDFLYKSFATSDVSYNAIDKLMKAGRVIEKTSANFMYATFYSVFWAWYPAMTQQLFSNAFHKFWKQAAAFWSESIDAKTLKSLFNVADELIPTELMRVDVFADRPELWRVTLKTWKIRKFQRQVNNLLQYQSTLAWADKSMEAPVKKYALASAMAEKWYQADSAKELMNKVMGVMEEFDAKGYSEYIDINNLVRFWDDATIWAIARKLNKAVEWWKLTLEESMTILSDIKKMDTELKPFKEITENAKIKTITFFQMSRTPELVQNFISWWAWTANMRFLNRASRKAWDYWYKIADAIVSKDPEKIMKILTQITAEWLYASKVYWFMNKAAEWGTDYEAYMWSMFLPYVVMNMSLLNMPENMVRLVSWWEAWQEPLSEKVFRMFYDTSDRLQWRIWTAPLYWATQTLKLLEWWNRLSERESASDYYSTAIWSVPVFWFIAEIFSDIVSWRIWRYKTDMTSWIYRDYYNSVDNNYFLNFISNAKITNDIKWADRLKQAMYNLTKEDSSIYDFWLKLFRYSSNNRMAVMAVDKYMKENWLYQLNWWVYAPQVLDNLERLLDNAAVEKTLLWMWEDYELVQDMINQDTELAWNEEWITSWEAKSLADHKYKVFSVITSYALMNSSSYDKALVEAGKWITKEDREKHNDNVQKIINQLTEELIEKEKTSPWLIKAAAYDPEKILKLVDNWKWRFWEQERIGIWMRALSNANRAIIKDTYKATEWKDWYKKNSKTMAFKTQVEKEAAVFDKELTHNMYNTVLLWNQTMAKNLQYMYMNADKNTPLSSTLTDYSSLWTYVWQAMLEKTIASEWLSSLWFNNPYAEWNSRIWNWYDWLESKDKAESLDKILDYKKTSVWYMKETTSPVQAVNVLAWYVSHDIDHLIEIWKDPELMEMLKDPIKDYIDRITVSEPLTDDAVLDLARDTMFKEPWSGKKKRGSIWFNKLVDNLNKFSWFKWAFYENVLKQKPLEHIQYRAKWNRIIPIKLPEAEAKKIIAKYDFIKPKAPVSEKTPDIVVQTIKTTKASWRYSWKNIKWQNVYTVKKTKRWR